MDEYEMKLEHLQQLYQTSRNLSQWFRSVDNNVIVIVMRL